MSESRTKQQIPQDKSHTSEKDAARPQLGRAALPIEEKDEQWKWGDSLEPSPHVVNSFLKREPREVIRFSVTEINFKK